MPRKRASCSRHHAGDAPKKLASTTDRGVPSFASGPLVMAALRKRIPEHERPLRVPDGHLIPFLAFWAANLIISWSAWSMNWKLFVAVLIGSGVAIPVIGDQVPVRHTQNSLPSGSSRTT